MGEKTLSASLEDYLEAILVLAKEHKVVRVRDLAKKLGVAPASVENAIKSLSKKGLILHEHYGCLLYTSPSPRD